MTTRSAIAAVVLAACATVPTEAPAWQEPTFISGMGVIVRTFDTAYLSPDMVATMEADLGEQFASLGVSRDTLLRCLVGVQVDLRGVGWWMCEAPDGGWSPCVGSTDGRWRVHLAHYGRCAYQLGSRGPTYEHELAHVVHRCLGLPTDYAHAHPIWPLIHAERACP